MPQTRIKSGIFGVKVDEVFLTSSLSDAFELSKSPVRSTLYVWRDDVMAESYSLTGNLLTLDNLIAGEEVRVNYTPQEAMEWVDPTETVIDGGNF
jgi:hypothetical protein